MAFTEAQREAIEHFQGPAMVLAGPGSGKTTVVTHRVDCLIRRYRVHPANILVVTFTRAAAEEMKSRFLRQQKQTATPVRFGTFHSVFFEILKMAYHFTAKNIAGEEACCEILRKICSGLDLDIQDEAEFLKNISQEISMVKCERINLDNYYSASISDEIFRRIFREYQAKLETSGLLDYDDLMVYTWELLTERSDILKGWQNRYRYILIDEFQDINRIQYEIVRLLASPLNNLFIVGDDDQSIYRFRGAKPEIMLRFPKDFPGTHRILLDCNFRCPANVMRTAEKVIGRNVSRYEKKIRCAGPEGEPVQFPEFSNQSQESIWIINSIRQYKSQGCSLGEIAVLYRSNVDARNLSRKFMEYNLPFWARDTIPNLYDHWIARNMISYLRAAAGDRSRSCLLPILNRPKRYLGRECLDEPLVDFERLRRYYEEKYWVIQKIDDLERDLRAIGRMDPYTAVNYIRHGVGYEDYLQEYAEYRKIPVEDLLEVLDQVQESTKGFSSAEEWFAHIREYGQMLKEQKQNRHRDQEQVTFSTLHSAKGLEFSIVYLLDVNEGTIPHKKARLLADIEEERRMFYVGMTRASRALHICTVKEKNGKPVKDSPFLIGIKP